jgi:hypothetical protein
MSHRSAKFVSALFATVLAGANFTAVAENGTRTADTTKPADNCQSAPKGSAPAGGHWYYHIDRATKRQCWYIGEEKKREDKKTARAAAPQDQEPSADVANNAPPPQQQNPTVSKSVAEARAEWPSPQSNVAQNADVTGAISAPDNSQRATAPESAQPSLITSRWPDASEQSSSNNPPLAAASPQVNASQATAMPAPPQPAVGPVALTAASAPLGKPSGSTQTLLMVMASALAFAGLVATLVFRFGRKPSALADINDDRPPAPWDSRHINHSSAPRFVHEGAPVRRADVAKNPPMPTPGDAEKRIAEMLTRLARSATA